MMVSTRGRYALRVLIDLAENQGSGYTTLREIAERQEISEKYLETIVKDLVKAGVLAAHRGKGGGYRLGRESEQIVVLDVLRLMEGSLAPVSCLEDGASPCARAAECCTLPLWTGLHEVVSDYLARFTIRDLMRKDADGFDYVI